MTILNVPSTPSAILSAAAAAAAAAIVAAVWRPPWLRGGEACRPYAPPSEVDIIGWVDIIRWVNNRKGNIYCCDKGGQQKWKVNGGWSYVV